MNRIEQVAAPTSAPTQPPQPRLPKPRTDVRRRAAKALLRPTEASARARRGTSRLALSVAALAVPLIPSTALGAVASGGAAPQAPQNRHHLSHHHVVPDPGALTVRAWATASGWTLTVPSWPSYADPWDHIPAMGQDGRYVPGPGEGPVPIDHPRPVVLPDGTHGEIAAYRASHTSHTRSHADSPDAPGTQIPVDPGGPDLSKASTPAGDGPPEWSSGGPSALRDSRVRVVPGPLIPFGRPANTKQMVAAHRKDADIPNRAVSRSPAPERVVTANAVVHTMGSPCMGAAYRPGNDRYMQVHLRPARDVMNVVVTPHRTACVAEVGYLSQARV